MSENRRTPREIADRSLHLPHLIEADNILVRPIPVELSDTKEQRNEIVLAKINALIKHARRAPFYQNTLPDIQLTDLSQMANLPFIDKQTLRENNRGLGSPMQIPGVENGIETYGTSGTTGEPILIYRHREEMEPYHEMTGRYLRYMFDPESDSVINLMQHGGGAATGIGFDNSLRTAGISYIPMGINVNLKKLVHYWKERKPNVGFIFPSNFTKMTEQLAEAGLLDQIEPLEQVFFVGEPFPQPMRDFVRGKTIKPGARIRSYLGNMEAGAMGMQLCDQSLDEGYMHVLHDSVYIMVVDPKTMQPVPKGTWGVGVVTSLNRLHAPIINFVTGDRMMIPDHSCSCGLNTDLIMIEGRMDSRIKLDATWFNFEDIMTNALNRIRAETGKQLAFYQVVVSQQDSRPQITVRIEANESVVDELRAIHPDIIIKDAMHKNAENSYSRQWFDERIVFNVELVAPNSLKDPKDDSKFKTVIDTRK